MSSTRHVKEVGNLFKNLMHIAQEYPGKEPREVRHIIKNSFRKNRGLTQEAEIEAAVKKGWYIYDQMERLISFAKYRHLKRKYDSSWAEDHEQQIKRILEHL